MVMVLDKSIENRNKNYFAKPSDYDFLSGNAQVANDTSNNSSQGVCNDASSYCGVLNARYPDARHMGYPFDRVPREGAVMLQQFMTPNMTVQDVRIKFTNRRVAPSKSSQGSANKKRN